MKKNTRNRTQKKSENVAEGLTKFSNKKKKKVCVLSIKYSTNRWGDCRCSVKKKKKKKKEEEKKKQFKKLTLPSPHFLALSLSPLFLSPPHPIFFCSFLCALSLFPGSLGGLWVVQSGEVKKKFVPVTCVHRLGGVVFFLHFFLKSLSLSLFWFQCLRPRGVCTIDFTLFFDMCGHERKIYPFNRPFPKVRRSVGGVCIQQSQFYLVRWKAGGAHYQM